MKKRLGVLVILVLAFCGLADSAYIAGNEAAGTPLLCNVSGLSGCNVVAASPYSHIFGISLAQYGLLFYGALFILAALELVVFDRMLRRALQGGAILGFIASLYFTFLQIFVINALCIYCMTSALVALLIFVSSLLLEPPPALGRAQAEDANFEPEEKTFSMPPWPGPTA